MKSYLVRAKDRRALTLHAASGETIVLLEGGVYDPSALAIAASRRVGVDNPPMSTIGHRDTTKYVLCLDPPAYGVFTTPDGTEIRFRVPVIVAEDNALYLNRASLPPQYELVELGTDIVTFYAGGPTVED